MVWVAVDKNGDEYAYGWKPVRMESVFSDDDEGETVELPKGSIEKLIGKVLTWGDEPIELKF